jgi:hypothetical protein
VKLSVPYRKRRLWIIAVLLVGVWGIHKPLLRTLAGVLVAEETASAFTYVCLPSHGGMPDGYRCYEAAVELCRQKPACGVLLIESPQDRLVETGILPSFEALSRHELRAQGLPQREVLVIHSDGPDDWALARTLGTWLTERPHDALILLCARFRSAHLRHVLDTALAPAMATRVRLRALRDRRYDESDWWMSRNGFKAFGISWLRLFYGRCMGKDHLPPPYCDADDYEQCVRQALSKRMP